jgi:hypothetical protein
LGKLAEVSFEDVQDMAGIEVSDGVDKWTVRRGGASRAWRLCASKKEAVRAAMRLKPKMLAKLYVHDEGGRIQRRICRPVGRR